MNLLKSESLIEIISVAVYFLILVTIPLRSKFILNRAGKRIVDIAKKNQFMQILIVVFSGILICLLYFKKIGIFSEVVICLVAILGTAMGSEEAALNGKSGLYEHGIICGGHFLTMHEIFALPTLSYSKEEQAALSERILQVQTDKKGIVNLAFSSATERNAVLDGLLKLNPALKA